MTTASTAVSSHSASTRYSFSHVSGLGRALRANSGEGGARLNEHFQQTWPHSNAYLFLCIRGKSRWHKASSEPGTSRQRVPRSAVAPHCLGTTFETHLFSKHFIMHDHSCWRRAIEILSTFYSQSGLYPIAYIV